jgi:hypothetical protein
MSFRFRTLFTRRRLIYLAVPATFYLASSPQLLIKADGPAAEKSTSWFQDFKASRIGIYENKLRKYSHPYKVFSYFSSIKVVDEKSGKCIP